MQMDIEREVAALRRMTTAQLHEQYAQAFGEESRSSHKTYLVRKIAWRLQAKAEGDLSTRARRRAEQLANDAEVRLTPPKHMPLPAPTGASVTLEVAASHDSRLPTPGTSLIRKYKGTDHSGQRAPGRVRVRRRGDGRHCFLPGPGALEQLSHDPQVVRLMAPRQVAGRLQFLTRVLASQPHQPLEDSHSGDATMGQHGLSPAGGMRADQPHSSQ